MHDELHNLIGLITEVLCIVNCMSLLMLYYCMFGQSPSFCLMVVRYTAVLDRALLRLGMWESDGKDVT